MYNGSVFIERKILMIPVLRRLGLYMPAPTKTFALASDRQMLVVVDFDNAARRSLENPLKGTFCYVHVRNVGSQMDALEHWVPIVSVVMLSMECNV